MSGAGSGGGGRPETFIITYGGTMSDELANAMRTALMLEMRAQNKTMAEIREMDAALTILASGDMLASTAQQMASHLGCRWEARLIHGTQPLAEGVALVRDTDP